MRKKKSNKDKNVNARFTKSEYEGLTKMAEAKNTYISSLVSHLVVNAVKRNGFIK